jgi:potassium-transporting ATPase KdpC subunit
MMASGSGLDPDITLQNAEFRLERVAAKWADHTKRNAADVRKEIDEILRANASTAFGGLAGEKLVNVLRSQFGTLQTLRIAEIGFK